MKLRWTPLAIDDLQQLHAYLTEHDPAAISEIIERIEKSLAVIIAHPQIGRRGRIDGTRELIIPRTPFLIPYRVRRDVIEILALFHAARRWPDALE